MNVQAYVYTRTSGECAAFLLNNDNRESVNVAFRNMHYTLPPTSISILPDCRTVVFNTAMVCFWNLKKLFFPIMIHLGPVSVFFSIKLMFE